MNRCRRRSCNACLRSTRAEETVIPWNCECGSTTEVASQVYSGRRNRPSERQDPSSISRRSISRGSAGTPAFRLHSVARLQVRVTGSPFHAAVICGRHSLSFAPPPAHLRSRPGTVRCPSPVGPLRFHRRWRPCGVPSVFEEGRGVSNDPVNHVHVADAVSGMDSVGHSFCRPEAASSELDVLACVLLLLA